MTLYGLECAVCGAVFRDDGKPSPRCPYCAHSFYADVEKALHAPTRDRFPVSPPEPFDSLDDLDPAWFIYQMVSQALAVATDLDDADIHKRAIGAMRSSTVSIRLLVRQAYSQVKGVRKYNEVPTDMLGDPIAESIAFADEREDVERVVLARGDLAALQEEWDERCPDASLWEALEMEWSECTSADAKRRYNRFRRALSRLRDRVGERRLAESSPAGGHTLGQ